MCIQIVTDNIVTRKVCTKLMLKDFDERSEKANMNYEIYDCMRDKRKILSDIKMNVVQIRPGNKAPKLRTTH